MADKGSIPLSSTSAAIALATAAALSQPQRRRVLLKYISIVHQNQPHSQNFYLCITFIFSFVQIVIFIKAIEVI
jgi:hypothetical protein